MDFEEVREYAVGDDVRAIDWNVSARMDKPYVKIFREERELTLLLVVDLSASGFLDLLNKAKENAPPRLPVCSPSLPHATTTKSACSSTPTMLKNTFRPKKEAAYPSCDPRYSFSSTQRQGHQSNSGTGIPQPRPATQSRRLSPLRLSRYRRRFFQSLALVGKRHDLINVVLSDPRESRLPDIGLITLEDAETAQVVEIDTGNPRMRQGYQTAAKERNERLAACLRSKVLDWVETSTDAPYMPALQQLFARRAKRF